LAANGFVSREKGRARRMHQRHLLSLGKFGEPAARVRGIYFPAAVRAEPIISPRAAIFAPASLAFG